MFSNSQIFSITLSFALLLLWLYSSSSFVGSMGFLVVSFPLGVFPHTQTGNSGGHVQPFVYSAKALLTILSSREWKVIIANLPPGASLSNTLSRASARRSSSPFTDILRA